MKDAFGRKLSVGDIVLYGAKTSGGTVYNACYLIKLLPGTCDRVVVRQFENSVVGNVKKEVTVHASNVVLLESW